MIIEHEHIDSSNITLASIEAFGIDPESIQIPDVEELIEETIERMEMLVESYEPASKNRSIHYRNLDKFESAISNIPENMELVVVMATPKKDTNKDLRKEYKKTTREASLKFIEKTERAKLIEHSLPEYALETFKIGALPEKDENNPDKDENSLDIDHMIELNSCGKLGEIQAYNPATGENSSLINNPHNYVILTKKIHELKNNIIFSQRNLYPGDKPVFILSLAPKRIEGASPYIYPKQSKDSPFYEEPLDNEYYIIQKAKKISRIGNDWIKASEKMQKNISIITKYIKECFNAFSEKPKPANLKKLESICFDSNIGKLGKKIKNLPIKETREFIEVTSQAKRFLVKNKKSIKTQPPATQKAKH